MRSLPDLSRLSDLKQHQSRSASAAGHAQLVAARTHREEAAALRRSSLEALSDSAPREAFGLTRRGFYERLRLQALARAAALEAEHRARGLDDLALDGEQSGPQLLEQAAAHERKRRQIEEWARRETLKHRLRAQRQFEREIQENHACRMHCNSHRN